MATCPDGHQSASEDYCDVCGMLIAGAPAASPSSPGSATSSPAGGGSASGGSASGGSASGGGGDACPLCHAPRSGVFCESCGYNFSTGQGGTPAQASPAPVLSSVTTAPPVTTAPSAPSVTPAPPVPSGTSVAPGAGQVAPATIPVGWTAVVAADRAYYDSVEAASGPDGSGIDFPAYCPERRFQLTGTEMRIGRRSPSRGIEPEIDLTGPPTDPGISRLHAVLIATPDGWAVIDPGSANGTQLNGNDIPTGLQLPVHDGDRINLGAWTTITLHHAA
jgi:FHA domain